MGSSVGGGGGVADDTTGCLLEPHKQQWIKYYCEACEAWETREMFEVAKLDRGPGPAAPSPAVWSWGCVKVIRHGTVQSFHVEHLNSDAAMAPTKLVDFPSATNSPATTSPAPQQQPSGQTKLDSKPSGTTAEEVSALHQAGPETGFATTGCQTGFESTGIDTGMHRTQSNGSSQQSKRPKRNVRSAYARDSPLNSQGGVTSSSPDENGASTVHRFKNGDVAAAAAVVADTAGPESPAVIDAELHDRTLMWAGWLRNRATDGVHKRPRRLTAGDRGLAQALQYERPRKMKAVAEVKDEKPSPSPAAAAAVEMKRPKRVTAGLKGMALAAENAKLAARTPVSVKKEKKDAVHQVAVQTRSSSAKKPSKKNKKVGDLY